MNDKEISITFDLGQVTNDILAKCNLISLAIKDDALADIKANVQEPDNPETRSIICRAITEAFGKVKVAGARWLKSGRTTDTNALERIAYETTDEQTKKTTTTYEKVQLTFDIPNFNTAVTDHLKSAIQKYVVDWTMSRFLQDQVADKAKEYKDLADGDDYNDIIHDLNMRETYNLRTPHWV